MKEIFIFTCIIGYFLPGTAEGIKILFLKQQGQEYVEDWITTYLEENPSDITIESIILNLRGKEDDQTLLCSNLVKESTIIIDLTWSGNEEAEAIAIETAIPYLQIDISISPFLNLLDQYLEYRNSTDVALIFDNPTKVDESLYFWIDTSLLRMVLSEDLDEATVERIKNIRPTPNNIAILATSQNMTQYFKKALQQKLVTLPERWNLVFLDFNYQEFDKSLLNHLPINILYLEEETCCRLLKIRSDCECPEDFHMQKVFFNSAMKMIIKNLQKLEVEGLSLPNNFECQKKSSESAIYRFNELLQEDYDDVVEKTDFALSPKFVGTVARGANLPEDVEVVAKIDHKGLKVTEGREIKPVKPFYRIGITHALPWSFKETDSFGNTYWTGYCVDFTEELSIQMNFEYEFVEPKSGDFGNKRSGVWNGVVGDLAAGLTDLAITALIMTADREEIIDFVAPYYEQTGITIVMRKPVRKTSLFKFMTVLKLEVWLSIVGALIVTGFMVWFLDKYSPYSARNNKKAYPYPCRDFTLKESFWFALTSFTPQGGGEAPKALSGRTLVAAYWLFVVLMLATFTANLAAFLTVERMQTPVQSLEQLAKQSRINYTVVKSSDTHIYFINMKHAEDTLYRMWKELTLNASTDDTQYRVWDYPIREQYGHILLAINDSNPVANASEGFRIVDEHTDADFAFIHDSSEIKYEISRNCNLTEVGEVFAEKPYAVAVQQGSHLQDQLSKTILNLQKDRFFEQLQSKYWNHSARGSCPNTDDNEGITLESLGGVFIATLFGLALSMLTLVGEVLYYRRKAKIQKTNKRIKIVAPSDQWKSEKLASEMSRSELQKTVTIGTEFKPVNFKDFSELSNIQLFPRPRNRIGQNFN